MSAEPPLEVPARAERRVPSLVVLHTGDGKGKTTAAMGIAMRAAGHGRRVAVIQFMKSGRWKSGERLAAERLGVDWSVIGDGFTWDSEDLARAAEIAREAWAGAASTIGGGSYDVVVLDEITYPLTWGWVPTADVVTAITGRPVHVSVVLTGRDAPAELRAVADTVSESTNVKHAFDDGVAALKGIDF
ncbi:MAG TPA: cob(I)yrinic acid a,c-diamide adenosyltransferase [Actinomycetota bacterium]|nr:cob(I)yrinic acid a,c-diamide adenosyltransferase [Actinomycetota bacterium]